MKSLSASEQMLYSTTKVTGMLSDAIIGYGTGFHYRIEVGNNTSIPLMMTNKHVIKGCDSIVINMHTTGDDNEPTGRTVECQIALDDDLVFNHPDGITDLCAIALSPIIQVVNDRGVKPFIVNLSDGIMPKHIDWQQFDAIESLVMIGCPNGIYDNVNHLPIVRRGFTSTPLAKNYNGESTFLMDMACYPGSSGSPIFVYDPMGYVDKLTNSMMMSNRLFFVGVLFRGPQVSGTGQIVFQNIPRVKFRNMMHLGEAIKTTKVKELADYIERDFKRR